MTTNRGSDSTQADLFIQATPQLFIVCGNAGVGKTTFALTLAREHKACLIDIDTSSERLVQAGLGAAGLDKNDRDSEKYKMIYREAIHETLFAIAAQNISHTSCVIVAPFTKERRDPEFLSICKTRVNAEVRIYYLVCGEAERRRRIQARGNPRDRDKLSNWELYSAEGQDPCPPPFAHVLIPTD
jgi:predicted kinase